MYPIWTLVLPIKVQIAEIPIEWYGDPYSDIFEGMIVDIFVGELLYSLQQNFFSIRSNLERACQCLCPNLCKKWFIGTHLYVMIESDEFFNTRWIFANEYICYYLRYIEIYTFHSNMSSLLSNPFDEKSTMALLLSVVSFISIVLMLLHFIYREWLIKSTKLSKSALMAIFTFTCFILFGVIIMILSLYSIISANKSTHSFNNLWCIVEYSQSIPLFIGKIFLHIFWLNRFVFVFFFFLFFFFFSLSTEWYMYLSLFYNIYNDYLFINKHINKYIEFTEFTHHLHLLFLKRRLPLSLFFVISPLFFVQCMFRQNIYVLWSKSDPIQVQSIP